MLRSTESFFGLCPRVLALVVGLLVSIAGCVEPAPPARPVRARPGPPADHSRAATATAQTRPGHSPPAQTTPEAPFDRTTAAAPPAPTTAAAPEPPEPAAEAAPVVDLGVHQLVLLSQPAPGEPPAGLSYVRTEQATARQVGELLARLYIASGPSGTENRYTLLYPSKVETAMAANAVPRLDVPPVSAETAIPVDPVEIYGWAIGRLHSELADRTHAGERLPGILDALMRVAMASEPDSFQKWSAAMIAGTIAADRLYDYERAANWFATAEQTADAGSYEQMTAIHSGARMAIQNGRPDRARQSLRALITRFSAFRGCEVFARAEETLAGLDAGK